MLKLIVFAAVVLLAGFGFFIAYRWFAMKRHGNEMDAVRFERVKVLFDKLDRGKEVTEQDVYPFAASVLTREITYGLLRKYEKTALFPAEFLSIVSAAESDLANWLEFPTELDAPPDEIEHVKRVTVFGEPERHYYEVFKYRVFEPHWAAGDDWMLGVVGPYFDQSQPYDLPRATFSRIERMEGGPSPEEEARWVHENIYKKFR